MSVKHVVLSQAELDLINRLIEKEKDSITHVIVNGDLSFIEGKVLIF